MPINLQFGATNYLRKRGMNTIAKFFPYRLYKSIDVSKMIGEIYLDCLDSTKQQSSGIESYQTLMYGLMINILYH